MFGHRSGFKLLWVGFSTNRQTNQMTTVDQCDHHSPVRSHALILWQVSTSAGSEFTALMEKRGAMLQGSVFKSINCSPNPTGSTFVIHPLLQARVGDSFARWEQHAKPIISVFHLLAQSFCLSTFLFISLQLALTKHSPLPLVCRHGCV